LGFRCSALEEGNGAAVFPAQSGRCLLRCVSKPEGNVFFHCYRKFIFTESENKHFGFLLIFLVYAMQFRLIIFDKKKPPKECPSREKSSFKGGSLLLPLMSTTSFLHPLQIQCGFFFSFF
jgi:hypothetical protein